MITVRFEGGMHNNFVNLLPLLITILFDNRHYNQSQLSYFLGCIFMVSYSFKKYIFYQLRVVIRSDGKAYREEEAKNEELILGKAVNNGNYLNRKIRGILKFLAPELNFLGCGWV